MCYSAQIEADYRKYLRLTGDGISLHDFYDLFWRRQSDSSIKIPKAVEDLFARPKNAQEEQIKALINAFNVAQANTLEQELFKQRKRRADAHQDPASKQRIGEEVADVLLYLLQVADQSEIDIAQAVRDMLARNALKYPATRAVARVSPRRAAMPGTHVLLDYENVQPTEDELRAMVPDASQVWVFQPYLPMRLHAQW